MKSAEWESPGNVSALSFVDKPPELEQALLRVYLGPLPLFAYAAVALFRPAPEAYPIVLACLFYVVFSVATHAAVISTPAPSRLRLIVTTITDQASVLILLAVGGELALPMVWALFWFVVGAGCRHGKRMLTVSCTVALVGLAALIRWEPWWHENLQASIGITLAVAATSCYLAVLVHRLETVAGTDPLTGLDNRKRLEGSIAEAVSTRNRPEERIAILLIDLDGFKQVNDKYGHGVGDTLLRQFARGLKARTRRGDTPCRLGGDEFVVLARHVRSQEDVQAIADGIHSILGEIRTIDGHPVSVSASIGACLVPTGIGEQGADIPAFIRHADRAMYLAKTWGKNQTVFTNWEPLPDSLAHA